VRRHVHAPQCARLLCGVRGPPLRPDAIRGEPSRRIWRARRLRPLAIRARMGKRVAHYLVTACVLAFLWAGIACRPATPPMKATKRMRARSSAATRWRFENTATRSPAGANNADAVSHQPGPTWKHDGKPSGVLEHFVAKAHRVQ